MHIVRRLVGYDRQTDRKKQHLDIPKDHLAQVKRIARVPQDDPDAVWSYPLSLPQARDVASVVCGKIDPNADFFLEAFGDHNTRNAS